MDRDKQIELMAGAEQRAKARTASWLADPGVKASMRRSSKAMKAMMAKPKQRRPNGRAVAKSRWFPARPAAGGGGPPGGQLHVRAM